MPSPQARAILRAIEIEIDGARDTLATKVDLLALRHDMAREMTEMRHELKSDIETLRGEVRGEVRGEIRDLKADLQAELHGIAARNAWQLYGALVAQMTMLLGVAYSFVTHAAH